MCVRSHAGMGECTHDYTTELLEAQMSAGLLKLQLCQISERSVDARP
jgi:hypothetical protein